MNEAIERGARAAARRMTTPTSGTLPEDVEAALATHHGTRPPDQYLDPTAVAGLIVSIATMAWTVYNDLRSRGAADPTTDAVTRRVRQQLDRDDIPVPQLDPAERDRIIDITVEETLDAAHDQDPENP